MKNLFVGLFLSLILILATPVMGEDIVVSITIPDAYVSRLVDMVNSKYMQSQDCNGLTIKECFIVQMIQKPIKYELYLYELDKARSEAIAAAAAGISQIEVNTE